MESLEELIAFAPLLAMPVLLAHAAAPGARQHALGVSLSAMLASGLACLLLERDAYSSVLTMLAVQWIAAPLLDRARYTGLLAAALAAGFCGVMAVARAHEFLLWLNPAGILLATIIVACLIGLGGSTLLPAHPTRANTRPSLQSSVWTLAATLWFSVTVVAMTRMPVPSVAISALSGAWVSYLVAKRTRHPWAIQRMGEGLMAGTLLAACAPLSPVSALVAGGAAAWLVVHGQRLADALRWDDPAHQLGTFLLPSLAGLLVPALIAPAFIADTLHWLAYLAVVAAIGWLVWPVSMLVFGLAAAPRQVRNGLDFEA